MATGVVTTAVAAFPVTSSSTDIESMSGSLQGSNTTVDSVNSSPKCEPEETEVTTVSQNAVNADETPLSDQRPKVNGESKNDPPNTQTSEAQSDPTTKEAEKAFLEMFRDLSGYYFGDVEGAHDYILEMERIKPLSWRKRQARNYSWMLQTYFRLVEDRLTALEDNTINHSTESDDGERVEDGRENKKGDDGENKKKRNSNPDFEQGYMAGLQEEFESEEEP
jgi:hypothetical protein